MQDCVHLRTAVMRTGIVRSLLPSRTQRLRYTERSPPVRRTGVVRSGEGGLDALLNEILEKHRRLYGTGEEEEEEKKQPKRILKKEYDYADRQNIWPSAEDDSDYIRLPPMNPGLDPEKGSVEQQVSMGYQQAYLSNKVDPEHMQYWFTTPHGGWKTSSRVVRKKKVYPGFFANAKNRGKNRPSISELEIGQKIRGEVTEVWLYHGIKVDIGYDYDGLLPMNKDTWPIFGDRLDVGDIVDVAVAKLWKKDIYRWPVQLRAQNPSIQQFMLDANAFSLSLHLHIRIPVKEWDPPVDMRGKSIEEIEKYTNRRLPTETWILPDDGRHEGHPKSRLRSRRVRKIVTSLDKRKPAEIKRDYYDDMYDTILDMKISDF